MHEDIFELEYIPELNEALLIAGFDGWGNALDVSRGMVDYMIRKLGAEAFGKINPDLFYRFDEKRPVVGIENGLLKEVDSPGCFFYTVSRDLVGRDIIFLKAVEPSLRWFYLIDAILSLCRKSGVKSIISLGSMYDNVLHTDTIMSALASNEEILAALKEKDVIPINYRGPGAIHSTIHSEAMKRGFESLSLWCHCPYYLQGTTHFGLMSYMGAFLSEWGGFDLNVEELNVAWKSTQKQIQGIIDKNPELQDMINDLRKEKVKGSWDTLKKHDKIIQLEDFL